MSSSAARASRRSMARSWTELTLFRAGAAVLRSLPRETALALARSAARLVTRLTGSRRRILLENLSAAFPEKDPTEIRAIARASTEGLGEAFVDFLEASVISEEEIRSRIHVVGEEHLRAARSRGRGVFLLSAHIGGWELGAIRAGLIEEAIAPVVRPLDNPLLEAELSRRRSRFGNRPIAKKQAARDILRCLAEGRTIAILIDQNVLAREAVFVPFFGRPAATTPALALFQLKTDAAVVPVFTWPEGRGRYRLEFEPPLYAQEFRGAEVPLEESVRRATARYVAVTEAAIRRSPAAWLWMHNRWRTRPSDAGPQ